MVFGEDAEKLDEDALPVPGISLPVEVDDPFFKRSRVDERYFATILSEEEGE